MFKKNAYFPNQQEWDYALTLCMTLWDIVGVYNVPCNTDFAVCTWVSYISSALIMKKSEKEVVGEGAAQSCICTECVCTAEGGNRRDQETKIAFAKVWFVWFQ